MIKRNRQSVVLTAFNALIKVIGSFVLLVPILSFWIAIVNLFQSAYYENLMDMRELAVNFFLMDLLVSLRQAIFTAVLVSVFGWVLYWIYRSNAGSNFDEPALKE